ncbi:MAG: GH3 auxin-responsive promoter family protein [Rikenellaceae bacterium]
MSLKSSLIKPFILQRQGAIDKMRRHPLEVQRAMFDDLLKCGARTIFGREHNIKSGISYEDFVQRVPLTDYEGFRPYIERMVAGQRDVSTQGRIDMFARSSGTTSQRSKYIPISSRAFVRNHMRGMSDVGTIYNTIFPNSEVLAGQLLTLGGSAHREGHYLVGDLSGILVRRFAMGSGWFRQPRMQTALLANFDEKCERICRECTGKNISSFAGVPSWNLALMSRVLEYTGKSNIREVWPNMELFIHGGVEMTPYRQAYSAIDGGGINYMETYNASEGFFAIADDLQRDDMLLMLDYETLFEFHAGDDVVPLEGVQCGVVYAVIITSSNGLWRYEIGDTIEFTSTDPYRIRFAGRTRQYINAFGEEVIVDNADKAIVAASKATGAVLSDYMVAPRFMDVGQKGCHQWLVEFIKPPQDMATFVEKLDRELRDINSDYDAKRLSTLSLPDVTQLERGTFMGWMRSNKKSKLPRLSNDRKMIEKVLEWIEFEKLKR